MKIKIYRNAILPLVSYCGGTGSTEEKQRLSVFLNCVLRNIFGRKGEEEKTA